MSPNGRIIFFIVQNNLLFEVLSPVAFVYYTSPHVS